MLEWKGGVTKLEDGSENFFLVCAACLILKDGTEIKSVSSKLELPICMTEKILKGEQFGVMVREARVKEGDLISLVYLRELLLRERSFSESIKNILISLNKKIDC